MSNSNNRFQAVLDLMKGSQARPMNPDEQQMYDTIAAGDNARGEQFANDLCRKMGISPQDAYAQACKFFGL